MRLRQDDYNFILFTSILTVPIFVLRAWAEVRARRVDIPKPPFPKPTELSQIEGSFHWHKAGDGKGKSLL